MSLNTPDAPLLERLTAIVGRKHALTDPNDMARYLTEPRGLFTGAAAMILRPGSTREVAEILKTANAARIAIVPQGGGTGLVGGQVPSATGTEIVVSLERLDRIRSVCATSNSMTVEAGVTLIRAQDTAKDAGRLFPLSLASEGTCQIGGTLATNAGGTAVLAYGNARDLVLGLEVVLADGRVWNGLGDLRKDNTGYDLKHLFVGAEGTLGIITAATLKLVARPRATATAFIGVPDPAAAVALLARFQAACGSGVTGFEIIPRVGMDFVLKHGHNARDPLDTPAPWYVLAELSGPGDSGGLTAGLENTLAAGHDAGEVIDAAIAASTAQAAMFWHLRLALSEVQKAEGGSIKHDISVPVADIPAFIDQASAAALAVVPGGRPVAFGHLGDGNLHFNISQPAGADRDAFMARWSEVNAAVHGVVTAFGGSISAEHGIGRLKRRLLAQTADPVGLALMKSLKQTLDPNGILNPGKVLEDGP
ncbi:D-2-hydroxyglutarate dehydrogenase [hydrothermal vent metagenome]|uniref:D-2-hydroxyglutarate dehydrogenase n=1 Tax=hydrothermal vent metagenome TaxID=652676 RepID=A0A3B0TXK8_9ZZZZ